MYRIELVTAGGVEALCKWPDAETARLMARHYRTECRHDPGFITVRVVAVRPKEAAGGQRPWR